MKEFKSSEVLETAKSFELNKFQVERVSVGNKDYYYYLLPKTVFAKAGIPAAQVFLMMFKSINNEPTILLGLRSSLPQDIRKLKAGEVINLLRSPQAESSI